MKEALSGSAGHTQRGNQCLFDQLRSLDKKKKKQPNRFRQQVIVIISVI